MHLLEMQAGMARVVTKQPVSTPRLSLDLRRKRGKRITEPCGRSGAHGGRRQLQGVGIERLRPSLTMLGNRFIGEALKLSCRFAKLPIPALVAFHLGEDGDGERILLGLRQLGNGTQRLVKKLGHTRSIAPGRCGDHGCWPANESPLNHLPPTMRVVRPTQFR